jgi:hypothetical protein
MATSMGEGIFDPGRAAFDFIEEIAGMTEQDSVMVAALPRLRMARAPARPARRA